MLGCQEATSKISEKKIGHSMNPPFWPLTAVQLCKTGYKCCYNAVLWWYRPIGMSPRICKGASKLRVRFQKNGAFGEPPILALFGPTTAVQRCKTGYKCCYNVVLCCIRPSLMSLRLCQRFSEPCQRFIEKKCVTLTAPILAL